MSHTANVYLSDLQQNKLAKAFRDGKKCTINIDPRLGNHTLQVTEETARKIRKARAEGVNVRVTLSSKQVQLHGGFIPFLIPLAAELGPILAGTAITEGVRALVDKISGNGLQAKTDQHVLGNGYILPFMSLENKSNQNMVGNGYILPFMRLR